MIHSRSSTRSAARAGYKPAGRRRVYESVSKLFDVSSPFPFDAEDAFIFPTPMPFNTLFHDKEHFGTPLLWRLFRSASRGIESVSAEDFGQALDITNVSIKKLTQTLFLINAHEFLPYDDATRSLQVSDRKKYPKPDWTAYRREIEEAHNAFPELMPYEINLLAYLSSRKSEPIDNQPEPVIPSQQQRQKRLYRLLGR